MKLYQPTPQPLADFRAVERVACMTAEERHSIWVFISRMGDEKRTMLFQLYHESLEKLKANTPDEKRPLLRKYRKNSDRYKRTVFEATAWVIMEQGLIARNAEAVRIWEAKAAAARAKKWDNSLRRRLNKYLPEVADLRRKGTQWDEAAKIIKRNHREFRGVKLTGKYLAWVFNNDYDNANDDN